MKIALVHDDLVQWGGAERVFLGISEIFPEAPIYTSVFDRTNSLLMQKFGTKKIITSFLQKIPGWKSLYKTLLPFYPIAFEQFDFTEFDLVLSHTTRFAKSIITKPETLHICYCHTPPRFLWNFPSDSINFFISPYINWLKHYDQISSKRVDQWLAGSENAKNRIARIYKANSQVLHPFVDLEKFNSNDSFEGGYFLIISRLNSYKRVDLAVKVFNRLKYELKIVGVGPELNSLSREAKNNISFINNVSDDILVRLVQGCRALIITSEEDFGLTALEAMACGKPVLAYGRGGTVETVIDKKTGLLFKKQSEDSLADAINKFLSMKFVEKDCTLQAKKFSKENFKQKLLKIINDLS